MPNPRKKMQIKRSKNGEVSIVLSDKQVEMLMKKLRRQANKLYRENSRMH